MAAASLMPFLRPLPLPRVTYIRLYRRRLSSQPRLCQEGTELGGVAAEPKLLTYSYLIASIISPNAVKSPPSPESSIHALPLAPSPPPPLAYHVHRTPSQQLPIYLLAKRGGNLRQTRIRKIEGDVDLLRSEIQTMLGIEEHLVTINRLTGHILVKVCGDTGRWLCNCD